MDRRSLLKSAASLTAVATLPATIHVAQGEASLPPVAQMAPTKLSPYSEYVWEWFVSNDGEVYHESFPTKEEAIAYAKLCDYSLVAECLPQDFNLEISGDWLIEHLNEVNYEQIGEDDGISATSEQERDLENMVKKAIEAWVVKHKIDIRAWSFKSVRGETKIA